MKDNEKPKTQIVLSLSINTDNDYKSGMHRTLIADPEDAFGVVITTFEQAHKVAPYAVAAKTQCLV